LSQFENDGDKINNIFLEFYPRLQNWMGGTKNETICYTVTMGRWVDE
jgi:hypothetical protein